MRRKQQQEKKKTHTSSISTSSSSSTQSWLLATKRSYGASAGLPCLLAASVRTHQQEYDDDEDQENEQRQNVEAATQLASALHF